MFKKNNKNNEEIISMEQTTFVQRHAKKISLIGGAAIAAGDTLLALGKYVKDSDILKETVENLIADNKNKDEEINFIKFLVVESDCIPKALQNAENKLARKETKIQALLETLTKCPNDLEVKTALEKHETEANMLREQIMKTLKLNELIINDENIYAK